jgi:hypothetical protein
MSSWQAFLLVCSAILSTAIAINCSATDGDPELQVKAQDSIVATITGNLSTTWDTGRLYYACVTAGGAEIELDPVGCPKVTRELLEFINTQGGGIVSALQVEAKGNLVFEKRPQTVDRRGTSRGDRDAVVPVLQVRSIKITTLPPTQDIGPTKRNRDKVMSTTVRRIKGQTESARHQKP